MNGQGRSSKPIKSLLLLQKAKNNGKENAVVIVTY
jgi:hypothetical protein